MEKGILVNDQVGGESVATRDAVQLDDLGNPRVIQRVDMVKGVLPILLADSIVRDIPASPDTNDLFNLPTNLTDNLVDCADKSTIVAFINMIGLAAHSVTIVPILFNNEVTPAFIGYLEPKTFTTTANSLRFLGVGYDPTEYYTEAQTWDVSGAYKVGFFISASHGDGPTTAKLHASVI